MFTLAGKPPQPTYHISEVSVIAQVDTVKPKLARHELEGEEAAKTAFEGNASGLPEGALAARADLRDERTARRATRSTGSR